MINHYTSFVWGSSNRAILVVSMLVFTLLTAHIKAQDIHFSQFDFNPLFLNPANTGNFEGDWRVGGTYRNQWAGLSEPYNTTSISGDLPLYILGQNIGVGLIVINDVAGAIGPTQNHIYGSVAYGQILNQNYFGLGLQVGMAFGSMESWGLWNRETGGFDLNNGEPDPIGKTSYFDINLGGIWKRNIHIFEPELGVNLMHLNSPNKSYLSGKAKVPVRMVFHATVLTKLTDKIHVSPKLYYSGLRTAGITMLGAQADYNLLGNRSSVKRFFAGAYLKNGILDEIDALTIQMGTTVGRLDIALGYDLGISNLSQSKTMGTFEFSFIYKSISTLLNSYSIPCERY